MCGFAGIFSRNPDLIDTGNLVDMGDAIRHRGPDDHGTWIGADGHVGFTHRRLAIIDLSAAGHQPMQSASGRFVIAYNGEIYNHLDMRKQMSAMGAIEWRGHSDTETLLSSFERIGIAATLESAVGMFAFAVWDRDAGTLTLARDRLGEKPFYYGWQGAGTNRAFLFGSDLAALRAHPSFEGSEDPAALNLFIRFGYVPAPLSIYAGIAKLEAGSMLTLAGPEAAPIITKYWDPGAVFDSLGSFEGTAEDAVDELERLTKRSVGRQMMSDVPIGAFLSGGVDSSLVTALMQSQADRPVRTFSIGFGNADHNEAVYAAAVATHLGTDHTELYVTPQMALDVVPKLGAMYSEPFADSSQIPVYLVSALARRDVTVALSGDGGDELFAGYNRYVLGARYIKTMHRMPHSVRSRLGSAFARLSPAGWARFQRLLPSTGALSRLPEKGPKIVRALTAHTPRDLYTGLLSLNHQPSQFMARDICFRESAVPPQDEWHINDDFVAEMMANDLLNYLPDDILCKVDRAAMSVSLETRVPLLDHAIVEFAWSLPMATKLNGGVGKWPLREVLYRYVPKALIERPKMGFAVPIDAWLRGQLREWAENFVFSAEIDGLDSDALKHLWARHMTGTENLGSSLWPLLMYRSWRASNL